MLNMSKLHDAVTYIILTSRCSYIVPSSAMYLYLNDPVFKATIDSIVSRIVQAIEEINDAKHV